MGHHGGSFSEESCFPQIRRIIQFFMIIMAITALSSVFHLCLRPDRGWTGVFIECHEFYIYQDGFENGAIGIASAAAVVLLGIATVLIVLSSGYAPGRCGKVTGEDTQYCAAPSAAHSTGGYISLSHVVHAISTALRRRRPPVLWNRSDRPLIRRSRTSAQYSPSGHS